MNKKIIIYAISLFCIIAFSTNNATAQITKCTDKKTGKISYTDGNCESEKTSQKISITDNIIPMGDEQSKPTINSYRNLRSNEIQKSLQATLEKCDQALKNSEIIRNNPRASKKTIRKSMEDIAMWCPMNSDSTGGNCPESTVVQPNPVLFNTGEIMRLDTGEIIKNTSYQYNYSYQYNPRIKFCRNAGKIYFQDKEMSVQLQ